MLNRSLDTQLTAIEHNIESFIKANAKTVCYMSVRDLADATFTSTATIMRFCKKYDCNGFSEFKHKLRLMYEEDTSKNEFLHLYDETYLTHFINNTTQASFQSLLEDATSLLMEKDLIYFLGIGSSKAIADYGEFFFSAFFSFVKSLDNPMVRAPLLLHDDLLDRTCFIVCSVTGETTEIIQFLKNFQTKCSIISLTNSTKSTIAMQSDINIPFYMPLQHTMRTKITSQVPAIYTLELLVRKIKEKTDDSV